MRSTDWKQMETEIDDKQLIKETAISKSLWNSRKQIIITHHYEHQHIKLILITTPTEQHSCYHKKMKTIAGLDPSEFDYSSWF